MLRVLASLVGRPTFSSELRLHPTFWLPWIGTLSHSDHFLLDGVREDYHGRSDEPQKIDYVKMEKVVRTVYMTLWQIAPVRPRVDKQLLAQLTQRAG